jgi:predicted amidohydrolase YtcJ
MCTDLPRNREAAKEQAQASQGVMGMGPLDELFPRGQCYLDIEYKGGGTSAPIKGNYFREWILDVAKNNLRIANIHVAGDATFTKMLSTFEEINAAKPGIIKGWGMDHCNLINPTDVSRIAKLGVMISCSTGELEDIAEVFGDKAANTYRSPFKSMLNLGINVSVEGEGQGSLWGAVEWIVTRRDSKGKVWGAAERLDRATALRIATQNGANYLLRGDKLGSLEVGKLADLVVLDRDYMAIPEEEISDIHALVAMVGGKIKFVNKQFSEQTGLRPAGALISSYDELVKRRKRFGSSRS